MKGHEIIEYIVKNRLWDEELEFGQTPVKTEPLKEPETLTEIADVTYEYGRVVLTIKPGYEIASRKFGLCDNNWKYEFDGGTMYFYKTGEQTSDWACYYGKGVYACVPTELLNCIKAVKTEMAQQIVDKSLPVSKSILWGFASR